ncbi:hypothetical protein ACHAW6_008907 [Cyclotella cf. meneghiniana]
MKRSPLTILLIASTRLCQSSSEGTVESTSVSASFLRKTRTSNRHAPHHDDDESSGGIRSSQHAQYPNQHRRNAQNSTSFSCIGSSLYPGEQIHVREFLCHERQRFGIDHDGRLILGLAASSSTSSSDDVSPSAIAWQAIPTTLFPLDQRTFHYVELSSYGNLVGYDEQGSKIYDSNLDYSNRINGKSAGSVLGFSSSCDDLASMPLDERCVRLTSPPLPGSPYGIVTWGVAINVDDMVSASSTSVSTTEQDSPAATGAPTRQPSTVSPSSSPTATRRFTSPPTVHPTEYPTTVSPSYQPTLSPVIISQAIIWASVWLDSNANGEVDGEEKMIDGVTVRLYRCDDDDDDDDDDNDDNDEMSQDNHNGKHRDNKHDNDDNDEQENEKNWVGTKITEEMGWFYFNVPVGGTYKAFFDVDDTFEFTTGTDGIANLNDNGGWTECVSPTINEPVQWKVGLHSVATDSAISFAAVEKPAPVVANSKIGGAIFIDLNRDGTMDSKESSAVEKGYNVSDAVVHISLHDCETDSIVRSEDVAFPGKYSFDELTEGLYKVEFDIVLVTPNKQTKESRLPMYSFFDDENDVNSSSFETNCINLRRNEANVSVHAGIRIPKLKVNTKVSEDLDVGDMEATPSTAQEDDDNFVKSTTVKAAASRSVEKKQSVPGVAAGILVVLALVVGSVLYVWHRRRSEDDVSVVGSVGSSVKGDVSAASTPSAPTAIGSMIVESSTSVVDAETKAGDEECGSNHDSDDDSEDDSQQQVCSRAVETETPQDTAFELELKFQPPYHQNPSSVFETESLDSDPYIYTGDEHEYDEDYHKWGEHAVYPQSTNSDMHEAGMQCQQDGSYVGTSANYGNESYYYGEESSVVSGRSSDPPAASYRNLPSAAHVYKANEHTRAVEDVYHIPPSNNNRCQSFDSDDSSSSDEESESSSSRSSSSSTNNFLAGRNRSKSAPPSRPHAGWSQNSMVGEVETDQHAPSQHHGYYVGPIVDDQSVLSAKSDHSTDPPGASYQTLGQTSYRAPGRSSTPPYSRRPFPPPPPPRSLSISAFSADWSTYCDMKNKEMSDR